MHTFIFKKPKNFLLHGYVKRSKFSTTNAEKILIMIAREGIKVNAKVSRSKAEIITWKGDAFHRNFNKLESLIQPSKNSVLPSSLFYRFLERRSNFISYAEVPPLYNAFLENQAIALTSRLHQNEVGNGIASYVSNYNAPGVRDALVLWPGPSEGQMILSGVEARWRFREFQNHHRLHQYHAQLESSMYTNGELPDQESEVLRHTSGLATVLQESTDNMSLIVRNRNLLGIGMARLGENRGIVLSETQTIQDALRSVNYNPNVNILSSLGENFSPETDAQRDLISNLVFFLGQEQTHLESLEDLPLNIRSELLIHTNTTVSENSLVGLEEFSGLILTTADGASSERALNIIDTLEAHLYEEGLDIAHYAAFLSLIGTTNVFKSFLGFHTQIASATVFSGIITTLRYQKYVLIPAIKSPQVSYRALLCKSLKYALKVILSLCVARFFITPLLTYVMFNQSINGEYSYLIYIF